MCAPPVVYICIYMYILICAPLSAYKLQVHFAHVRYHHYRRACAESHGLPLLPPHCASNTPVYAVPFDGSLWSRVHTPSCLLAATSPCLLAPHPCEACHVIECSLTISGYFVMGKADRMVDAIFILNYKSLVTEMMCLTDYGVPNAQVLGDV